MVRSSTAGESAQTYRSEVYADAMASVENMTDFTNYRSEEMDRSANMHF
jgi:hypothetical protein